MFAGIEGIARKASGAYIGVDGVARRAKKAYVGVDGVARLAWEAGGRVRAYLYNRVKLPEPPKWDAAAAPEAVIIKSTIGDTYFYCGKDMLSVGKTITGIRRPYAGYILTDSGWSRTDYWLGSPLTQDILWANYDVYYKDSEDVGELAGTLFLAASNPVPLYSYNGVELPELPGAVKDYRYIWVRRIPTYILKKAYWVFAQNTISYAVSDTGAECINVPASSLRYRYYVETDPSDWVIAPIEDDGDDRIATKSWLVWSNFPMLDTTDTIIMAASAPQPVYL